MIGGEIPVKTNSGKTYNLQIPKGNLKVVMWWQSVDKKWYCTVSNSNNKAIVRGRRMVSGSFIFSNVKTNLGGDILVVDKSGKSLDPSKDSFEKGTHGIYWVSI